MIFKKSNRFYVISYACSDDKKDRKTPHIKMLIPYIYTLVRKYMQPEKFSPASEEEKSIDPFVIIKKPLTIRYYYIIALSHYGRQHYVHIAIEDGKINFYCTVPGLDWFYWGNNNIETIIKATHGQDLEMVFHRDKCQLNSWECGLYTLDMIILNPASK
ncbi:MAG: hypothetical protein GY821_13295 [Gammaproteobacteria bacterium]|nr:hypothetical protein [Gammaproteobacteria bacterium]